MLLPTVTPLPGPLHSHNLQRVPSSSSVMSSSESAAVTLLKLQLASMENLAKERLAQISKLEEQMHVLKESRKRDERELLTHVNELEQRLHETLTAQQRWSLTILKSLRKNLWTTLTPPPGICRTLTHTPPSPLYPTQTFRPYHTLV